MSREGLSSDVSRTCPSYRAFSLMENLMMINCSGGSFFILLFSLALVITAMETSPAKVEPSFDVDREARAENRTCPDPEVRFYLYTRSNIDEQQLIHADDTRDASNLSSSFFNPQHPSKIIIHGFRSDMFLTPLHAMKTGEWSALFAVSVLWIINYQSICSVIRSIFSMSTGTTCHRVSTTRQSFATLFMSAPVRLNWLIVSEMRAAWIFTSLASLSVHSWRTTLPSGWSRVISCPESQVNQYRDYRWKRTQFSTE